MQDYSVMLNLLPKRSYHWPSKPTNPDKKRQSYLELGTGNNRETYQSGGRSGSIASFLNLTTTPNNLLGDHPRSSLHQKSYQLPSRQIHDGRSLRESLYINHLPSHTLRLYKLEEMASSLNSESGLEHYRSEEECDRSENIYLSNGCITRPNTYEQIYINAPMNINAFGTL